MATVVTTHLYVLSHKAQSPNAANDDQPTDQPSIAYFFYRYILFSFHVRRPRQIFGGDNKKSKLRSPRNEVTKIGECLAHHFIAVCFVFPSPI
jgi:hypothetical protein